MTRKRQFNNGAVVWTRLLQIFLIVVIAVVGVRFWVLADEGDGSAEMVEMKEKGGMAELNEADNKKVAVSMQDFALCLKENGMIMYGVDTCSFCKNQKRMFGRSFEEIDYRNCQFKGDECGREAISQYPTWVRGNVRAIGFQSVKALAKMANCEAPEIN